MKTLIISLAAVVAVLCIQAADVIEKVRAQGATLKGSYVEGELLVKFKDETARQRLTAVHDRMGSRLRNEFIDLGWQHIKLAEGLDVKDAVAAYKSDPSVALAQPNFIYRLETTPNDPEFGSLYGMQRISAPAAWETTTGDPNVVVAVIDTGIDKNHPDLAANVWVNPREVAGNGIDDDQNGFVDDINGWDFLNQDNDPADGHDHGTHCSGTIGGVGNNGIGVAGVNWNVKIMAMKTHDDVVGGSTSVSVIKSFQYVAMMKDRGVNIRATSNSYGGPPEAGTYDQAVKDAIDVAGRNEILNVFAAGNTLTVGQVENDNDRLPTYPGSYNSPSILAVAASDQNDNKASFSHYGLTTVDVAAPGVSVRSTVVGGGYANFSGTSMSTPHTAGAAALIAAAHPTLSAASIKATLMNTVDVLPQWNGFTVTGGRINVARAIAQPTVCKFRLSTTATSWPYGGGSGTVNVTSPTNCTFAGWSDQPWVVVTSDPGSGNGATAFTVLPNPGLTSRSANLYVGGRVHFITQAGLR